MSVQIPGIIPVTNIDEVYPGSPLKLGDISPAVLNMKNALNVISVNYTAIPKITPINSVFDESMEAAVKQFQTIFNLAVTGIIEKATWYEIRKIYNAVRKLATTSAEALAPGETPIEHLEVIPRVQLAQYFLNVLSAYYTSIPAVDINGMLDQQTVNAINEFQKTFNLPVIGIIDNETWITMYNNIQGILKTLPPTAISLPALLYLNEVYSEGSEGPGVYMMQQFLNYISVIMPDLQYIIPNGIFGPETTAAIKAFETQFGLEPNGIIDEETWNKIVEVYRQLRFSTTRTTGQFPGSILG